MACIAPIELRCFHLLCVCELSFEMGGKWSARLVRNHPFFLYKREVIPCLRDFKKEGRIWRSVKNSSRPSFNVPRELYLVQNQTGTQASPSKTNCLCNPQMGAKQRQGRMIMKNHLNSPSSWVSQQYPHALWSYIQRWVAKEWRVVFFHVPHEAKQVADCLVELLHDLSFGLQVLELVPSCRCAYFIMIV